MTGIDVPLVRGIGEWDIFHIEFVILYPSKIYVLFNSFAYWLEKGGTFCRHRDGTFGFARSCALLHV